MSRFGITSALVIIGVVGVGCASNRGTAPRLVQQATPQQQAALFDQVKSLEGTWEMTDENGVKHTACVFQTSSNGTVVREIMFPGSQHEMTNVYHMDGPTLVVTHFCAAGNQPRMRAHAGDTPGVVAFTFDSVSNLTRADETYMGQLTLIRTGPDTMREEWKSLQAGRVTEDHNVNFELTRKK